MAKTKLLTIDEIERLNKQAKKGSEGAIEALRKYNREISRLANQRLARLEKAELDYYAYDRAVAFTESEYGGSRFRYDYISLPSTRDVYDQVLEVQTFLESESSTVRGQRNIQRQRLQSFRDMGVPIPKNPQAERAFINFLNDSDTLDLLKKSFGSEQLFGYIADMLAPRNTRTKRLQDLSNAFKKALDNEETLDVTFENLGIDIFNPPDTKINIKE